jgi:hypothetical protein
MFCVGVNCTIAGRAAADIDAGVEETVGMGVQACDRCVVVAVVAVEAAAADELRPKSAWTATGRGGHGAVLGAIAGARAGLPALARASASACVPRG